MTEPKRYELTTIEDIYRKVPADRWNVCLDELKTMLMEMAKSEREMRRDIPRWLHWLFRVRLKRLTWVDDGLGEVHTNSENQWNGRVVNRTTSHTNSEFTGQEEA